MPQLSAVVKCPDTTKESVEEMELQLIPHVDIVDRYSANADNTVSYFKYRRSTYHNLLVSHIFGKQTSLGISDSRA